MISLSFLEVRDGLLFVLTMSSKTTIMKRLEWDLETDYRFVERTRYIIKKEYSVDTTRTLGSRSVLVIHAELFSLI